MPSGPVAHRYDTESHMGLLTLSKNNKAISLISIFVSRQESRPNKAIVMIFAAQILYRLNEGLRSYMQEGLLRIKVRII